VSKHVFLPYSFLIQWAVAVAVALGASATIACIGQLVASSNCVGVVVVFSPSMQMHHIRIYRSSVQVGGFLL
jgi:hypothetical protein